MVCFSPGTGPFPILADRQVVQLPVAVLEQSLELALLDLRHVEPFQVRQRVEIEFAPLNVRRSPHWSIASRNASRKSISSSGEKVATIPHAYTPHMRFAASPPYSWIDDHLRRRSLATAVLTARSLAAALTAELHHHPGHDWHGAVAEMGSVHLFRPKC